VLKSHLQSLPLPLFPDDTHRAFSVLHHEIIAHPAQKSLEIQNEIDAIICKWFSISDKEYNYIKGVIDGKTD
jgi:hypothetical protein